ncbi:MAG TPA: alpha/beta hydrolase [Phycisphaerales bacterium]|nr:alpha/beta hydrolase [Phycisphaerales bacterium]
MTTAATKPMSIPSAITLTGLAGVPVPVEVGDTGTGHPIVFLHGLVGLNDHWEDVVERLKGGARCILLELPLLGLTGDDCSIHGAVALTIKFLEQHVREPATLVGNSFGGHVALRIAIERPDLVRGLVLAGASGLIEKTMVKGAPVRPSREWLQEKIGELFYDRSKMDPGDVDRAYTELTQRGHARAMVKLSKSARHNHLGDQIHTIKAPTLIIWGKQDVVTPPEACHEFAAKIRDTRVVWFDKCGHAPMLECPVDFSEALRSFVAELDRRASV